MTTDKKYKVKISDEKDVPLYGFTIDQAEFEKIAEVLGLDEIIKPR